MNGSIVVDTNAVIAYREGIQAVCLLIENADTIFLPAIVLGELLFGAANSGRPESNQQAVREFQTRCAVTSVDETVAERYSAVRSELKRQAKPIPENDL